MGEPCEETSSMPDALPEGEYVIQPIELVGANNMLKCIVQSPREYEGRTVIVLGRLFSVKATVKHVYSVKIHD